MNYPSDWKSEYSKKPICGVLSVATCAGITFDEATKAIKANLQPWQKRHGGKTYHEQRVAALRSLGKEVIVTDVVGRVTLGRVLREFDFKLDTYYMIMLSTHIVTLHNGWIQDQYELSPQDLNSNLRRQVKTIVEIV